MYLREDNMKFRKVDPVIVVIMIISMLICILGFIFSMSNIKVNNKVSNTSPPVAGVSKIMYDSIYTNDVSIIPNDVDIVESYYEEEPVVDGAPFEIPSDNELGYDILYATDRVNLRSEPNDTSDILGVLDIGDEVKIYGKIGNDIWSLYIMIAV